MTEKTKNLSLDETIQLGRSVSPSVFRRHLQTVWEQVDAQSLLKLCGSKYRPIIDVALKVMAEVYMLDDDHVLNICGESITAGTVKSIYRELTCDQVCYAVNCFMRKSSLITSHKRYMRACLYNAYFDCVLEEFNCEAVEVTDDEQR